MSEETQDYHTMPLEEMESLLTAPPTETETGQGEETPAENGETQDEIEAQQPNEAEVEAGSEAEATTDEVAADDDLGQTPTRGDSEELRLRLEEAELQAKRWERKHDTLAGRIGNVDDNISRLKAELNRRAAVETVQPTDDDGLIDEPARQPVIRDRHIEPESDGLRDWAINQAVTGAVTEFFDQHPDLAEDSDAVERIKEAAASDRLARVRSLSDPRLAEREVRGAFEDVLDEIRLERLKDKRLKLSEERADQLSKLEKRKTEVTAVGSTSKPARPLKKTYEQMSDDELAVEMEKERQRLLGG